MASDGGKRATSIVEPARLRVLGSVDLRGVDGQVLETVLLQPKRLALLVYLVLTAGGQRRRDSVLALFWPELADEQARGALRQSLYFLRHALGPDAIVRRPDGDIEVVPDRFWCDALAFERLLAEGRTSDALELYRGDLLAGFYVPNASPELQQWLDAQRDRLRRLAANASSDLAESLDRAGAGLDAVRWAHWACEHSPEDETLLRRLIALLDRRGDRYGALLAYERFAERTAREFGAEPSPETREAIESVRARVGSTARAPSPVDMLGAPVLAPPARGPAALLSRDEATEADADVPLAAPSGSLARPTPRRRLIAAAGILVSAVLVLVLSLLSLRDRGLAAPAASALAARRLFEAGMRARAEGDDRVAGGLFLAAVEEDSTLAIAAYNAAGYARDAAISARLWGLALRYAAEAPASERLEIRLQWARTAGDPTEIIFAESLRTLAPENPGSHLQVALSLLGAGDFLAGVPVLRKAVALGTIAGVDDRTKRCAACEAYSLMAHAYTMADSLEAADRVLREWIRRYPTHHTPWGVRAWLLATAGKTDSAHAAWRRATSLRQDGTSDPLDFAHVLILAGDYAQAEAVIETASKSGSAQPANDAAWWRVIALRHMGRLQEAMQAARAYERHPLTDQAPESRRVPRAVVLLESGRTREALAIFDSMSNETSRTAIGVLPSVLARDRTWALTRAATAAAAAGDTARLTRLADTVERVGRASYYERDRRLHHYVRANLLAARGDLTGAVDAYRRSFFSTAGGYTRTNFELGNVLLALGRADEAVSIARSALHGGAEASNLYITRTELHALLARAHEAAGARDSAAAHYRHVAAAWSKGDPPFRLRAAAASRKMAELTTARTAP